MSDESIKKSPQILARKKRIDGTNLTGCVKSRRIMELFLKELAIGALVQFIDKGVTRLGAAACSFWI
ncbi:hypothetical protein ACWIFB_00505 [Dietzia sp. NPDC055340]